MCVGEWFQTTNPTQPTTTNHRSWQLKEAEAARLREEAEAAVDARRFLQEEVEGLRRALASVQGGEPKEGAMGAAAQGEGGGGEGLFGESVGAVRERAARLERENRALKLRLEGA